MCNWNQPDFAPVILSIQDVGGQEVAGETFTPTVNIGGDPAGKFTRFNQQVFEFDIAETGNYVIVFYTDAAKNADFVLGQVAIQAMEFVETGIGEIPLQPVGDKASAGKGIFDLSGRRIATGKATDTPLKPGTYIVGGRKVLIR